MVVLGTRLLWYIIFTRFQSELNLVDSEPACNQMRAVE